MGRGEGEKVFECVSSLSFLKILWRLSTMYGSADSSFLDMFASATKEAESSG